MSNKKQELAEQLISEVRMSQVATDRYDQAVADALGANRTDMRCLDVLEREGPITAGALAAAAGLTSGATTTVIDRLERAGFARRVADASDRRRVLVELTPASREIGTRFYAEHAKLGARLYRRYSEQQLAVLLEFVRAGRELNERQASSLEANNRAREASRRRERAPRP